MKIAFKRNNKGKLNIQFRELTEGEALSLCNSIALHAKNSPVASDLQAFLANAIQHDGGEKDQELFEAVKGE